jgi:hypothetical protein
MGRWGHLAGVAVAGPRLDLIGHRVPQVVHRLGILVLGDLSAVRIYDKYSAGPSIRLGGSIYSTG